MARTPDNVSGQLEWREFIEQPGGRNVFAKNVRLAAVNGAQPIEDQPFWLSFENESTTLQQDGTRVRPVQIFATAAELVPPRTYTFEIIATNGRSTTTRSVDLSVTGIPRLPFIIDYKRFRDKRTSQRNVVTAFLPSTIANLTPTRGPQTGFGVTSFTDFSYRQLDSSGFSFSETLFVEEFDRQLDSSGFSFSETLFVEEFERFEMSIPVSLGTFKNPDPIISGTSIPFSPTAAPITPTVSSQIGSTVGAQPRNIIIPNIEFVDWNGSAVELNWITTDPNISHYNVYRSTNPDSGFTEVSGSNVTSMSYTDTGVNKDTTYYYQVTSVDGNSNESVPSFTTQITTSADILIDSFEADTNVSDFTQWDGVGNPMGENTQPEYSGRRSAGLRDNSADAILLSKTLPAPRRPDRFRVRYWETTDSTGGGFRLLNSDGDPEVQFATDNPEWEFEAADGTTTEVFNGERGGTDVYQEWHEVAIEMDWANGDFDYRWTRLSDGAETTGTRSLGFGQGVEQIRFQNYASGFSGAGNANCHMQIDDIALLESVNNASTETVQINSALVDTSSSVSDFPVYVDLSDLTDEWWSNATGASSVQVFDDTGTEVPREVVTYDDTNQEGELWFKANTLKTGSDTKFDIEGAGSFTGTEANTWSDYEMVLHLHEDPSGSAPQYIDATGNAHDGTAFNTPMQANGQIGGAADFQSGDDDRIEVPDSAGLNPAESNFTLQAVVNFDNQPSNVRGLAGKQNPTSDAGAHYGLKTDGAQSFRFEIEDSDGDNVVLKFSTGDSLSGDPPWYRLAAVRSAVDSFELFSDGISQDAQTGGNAVNSPDNSEPFNIGKFGPNTSIDGQIDEVRFLIGTRNGNWLRTEHWNTDQPDGWYTVIS